MKKSAMVMALALLVCLSGCGTTKSTWTASEEEGSAGSAALTQEEVTEEPQEVTVEPQEATEEPTEEAAVETTPETTTETDTVSTTGTVYDKVPESMRPLIEHISLDTAEAVGLCGPDLRWYFQSNVLVITGTGDMTDFPEYSAPWNDIKSGILCVVIEDGVTNISEHAFYYAPCLNGVYIADSVTSIGEHAFMGCDSLAEIEIPDSVTSIGDEAFYGCDNLTRIEIPDSVTSIGAYAFSGCTSLTEIVIPEGVTYIGHSAFEGCNNLTEIEIPEGVTYIERAAFNNGPSEIHLPSTLAEVGDCAFYFKSGSIEMYFAGTEAQWNSIGNIENSFLPDGSDGDVGQVYYDGRLVESGAGGAVVNVHFNS